MKKFFNILLLLGALGLVVACKPAGNTGAKLNRYVEVDPVDPVKPKWDGDPEEILTQKGFAWFATANGSYVPDDFGFMGFCKKDGQLYVYHNDSTNQAYRPKNAKDTWASIVQSGVKDVDTSKNGWHKVILNKKDEYTYTFTISKISTKHEFKLDINDKALKVFRNGKRESDFYKWYLDPKISQLTPQMQALKPNVDKVWHSNAYHKSEYVSFLYDESTQRLYYYWDGKKSDVRDALAKKNFSSNANWQLVYPDPEGDPNVFYTMGEYWNIQLTVEPNGILSFVAYDYREGGKYYENSKTDPDVFKGTIKKDQVASKMYLK